MNIDPHYILPGVALVIIGALGFLLIFFAVPHDNRDLIIYVLGALSGALTVAGGGKIADKLTTSTSDSAVIQPEGKQ